MARRFKDKGDAEVIVYALIDPRNDAVRYVGKSHRTAHRRLRRHVSPSYLKGDTHRERWVRSLIRDGLEPRIIILEECDSADELCRREIHWIDHYRGLKADLTNASPGGDGGSGRHTAKSKAKIRAALLGKPKSAQHRRRVGDSQRGRIVSDATKRKLSITHKGKPTHAWSEQSLLKLSRGKGGRPFVDQYGVRYEMQTVAAEVLGVDQGHISKVLHGKRKHVKGMVFRFVEDLRIRQMPSVEAAV